ncbi:MAG: hypothetical protein COB02_16880 [Candidatus Cloacimonadota bacterium]|nr:MAG: hypothetical protein COB02_16880 [Candidatus Cloacimonadota bacterium]
MVDKKDKGLFEWVVKTVVSSVCKSLLNLSEKSPSATVAFAFCIILFTVFLKLDSKQIIKALELSLNFSAYLAIAVSLLFPVSVLTKGFLIKNDSQDKRIDKIGKILRHREEKLIPERLSTEKKETDTLAGKKEK